MFLGLRSGKDYIVFSCLKKINFDLLKETAKLGCNPAGTPLELNWKQKDGDKDTPLDKGRYQRLVRKLIYVSFTRPDITLVVSVVSQRMHSPNQ